MTHLTSIFTFTGFRVGGCGGLIVSPPNSCPSGASECSLLGNRVLADEINLGSRDEVILDLGWALNPIIGVFFFGISSTLFIYFFIQQVLISYLFCTY